MVVRSIGLIFYFLFVFFGFVNVVNRGFALSANPLVVVWNQWTFSAFWAMGIKGIQDTFLVVTDGACADSKPKFRKHG